MSRAKTKVLAPSGLTFEQERFCQLYAGEEEFFGNGTQSYYEAFKKEGKPLSYQTAMVNASKLLSNAKILSRINELLEIQGLNDAFVDKQLALVILQNADYRSKVQAIHEYNELKSRINKKLDINVRLPKPIADVSSNDSVQEDQAAPKTIEMRAGRDFSIEDSLDSDLPDSESANG